MTIKIDMSLPDEQLQMSTFCKTVNRFGKELDEVKQYQSFQHSDPNVDLHFVLPDKNSAGETNGMRLHSFDKTSNTLKIETDISFKMLLSIHAKSYVMAMLQDAVDSAYDFFEMQKIPFQRDKYLLLIEDLYADKQDVIH